MTLAQQVVETWQIHSRIVLYVLNAISADALHAKPVGMKGRAVSEIFAHVHNIRVIWLEGIAPEVVADVLKVPVKTRADKDGITHEGLRTALESSASRVAAVLTDTLDEGTIRNFKPHPSAFLGYLISHEGYHLGEIGMTLTLAGHPLPDDIAYGMWEWGKR